MRTLRRVSFGKCFTVNVPICEDGGVRFTPKSGHVQCRSRCLLWAISGHFRDVATALLLMDSISANSDWCSGRDTRSLPLNLDYYRR